MESRDSPPPPIESHFIRNVNRLTLWAHFPFIKTLIFQYLEKNSFEPLIFEVWPSVDGPHSTFSQDMRV